MLNVENITVTIENRKIVDDVSFNLKEHDVLMIIGPNGAGKTTLIRAIMGTIPHSGKVWLGKTNLNTLKPRALAKRIGVLTQKHQPQFPHTVFDVVSMGRYAYKKILSDWTRQDKEKIEEAINLTGIENLRERSVLTLSGGELQRVFLAQLFAQDPQILIFDEPTNHLDLQYQIAIFDLIKNWAKGSGRAVIAVVHDLNTVYSYGTKALLMDNGRVYARGSVRDVLSRENLKGVYKVDVAQWMQSLLKHWDI